MWSDLTAKEIIELATTGVAALGVGAVLTELVRRWRSKPENKKTAAEADVLVIDAVAGSIAMVTTSLRQEIERLQSEAGEVRDRANALEGDLRVALARVDELQRALNAANETITELKGDVERIRAERDAAQARVVQQDGEIRQLKAVVTAQARVGET